MGGFRDTLSMSANELGIDLSADQLRAFELFSNELRKWNRKINLTAISEEAEIARKHIADSLVLAQHLQGTEKLLDVGSGAGIPAIPLKIAIPALDVVSVDAVGKKIHFQRHVARLLELKKFQALNARIESLHATHANSFQVITSRAFADLGLFVRLAAPLLARGGKIIAMKGPAVVDEIERSEALLTDSRFRIRSVHSYRLPQNSGERCLVILEEQDRP